MPRSPSKSVLLSTAYHEAGHAVAAFLLRVPFEIGVITIVPEDGADGCFTHANLLKGIDLEWEDSDQDPDQARIGVEKTILICLSGMEAQRRHRASSVRSHHARADYEKAVDLAGRIFGSSEVIAAYMKFLLARAKSQFNRPGSWKAVEVLAGELMKHGTLQGSDALKVIRAAFAVRS
jgi:hypothetical protein